MLVLLVNKVICMVVRTCFQLKLHVANSSSNVGKQTIAAVDW